MFDSLKGKFKNIFKKDHDDHPEKDIKPEEKNVRPPEKDTKPKDKDIKSKDKAVKPEKKKPVYDDLDDDDFEFGDDLVEDGFEDDEEYEDDLEDTEDVKNNDIEKDDLAEVIEDDAEDISPEKELEEYERGIKEYEDSLPGDKFSGDPTERDDVREPVKAVEKQPEKEQTPEPPRYVEPVREPVREPVKVVEERPAEPPKYVEPPVPAKPAELSRKEQIKLEKKEKKLAKKEEKLAAKQEKIAAKEEKHAAKEADRLEKLEKKHDDSELVGDHGKKIKERNLDDLLWELEIALMEADVALPVVEEIMKGVKEDLSGKRYARGYSLGEIVELSVKDSISGILKINEFDFDAWLSTKEKPTVVMFVGINGTGKTTAIAKIANRLIKNERSVVLAASDTFRAGAIEQLTIHSERLGCKIVKHSADADPAAVAFDAIEHAKAKRKDVVLVDTAGRMQTNSNLMDEMKKIKKVARPHLVVFVGDSLAGNDAVEQARAFDAAIGVDAIMLTKIDADSKGGAALSIAHTIGKPIAFVSNGQEYDQLVKFSAKWMMDRLFED